MEYIYLDSTFYAPSLFNAFNICPRQAWLMSRQLNADQYNEFLAIGRLIDETSFKKEKKKIYLADIEAIIDMIVKKDKIYYIVEIKKSSKTLESGILQLKYYLYLLKIRKSIEMEGLIKIPKEKININVILTEEDIQLIEKILIKMKAVLEANAPPNQAKVSNLCKKCAYFEFCWA